MKTILITGATSGIGLSLVHAYLKQGDKVYACGRNFSAYEESETLLEAKQTLQLMEVSFDLTDSQSILTSLNDIESLDIAILNAGTCEYIDNAEHFDGALFERVIQTNVISIGYCLQVLIPKMKYGAHLALMGSSASYVPFQRAEAYGASKAAIHYLAKSLQLDIPAERLTISVIAPGFVKTPLTNKNDFPMPMLIEVSQAASHIISGITKNKKHIHFPFPFTSFLIVMGSLPDRIWQWVALRMKR
ncbi:SDR family NAD(P)-dependent oxidoreductase [Aliivibrio finisterrensis]|uniref:SDR family NAD(P)-dependent oxidoreductase n=1 Tax=Aliivibrio finisterrensis TaxID=511998 RepID=A0A4Q5KQB1_9GAMM|nr:MULTISPECIES: SDR family NAD(P)-dependent oxidoreductase [Aliivibrio]MDD9174111.1 SDR family NAD(P)-dependent oxidoreductase [Aliivibrio sp. S3TY1]MDD9191188.1 SDR family NAD(P)-dependent oxidoreductase [Aliivibrio sp. S2TY2]RYU48110.1 SDR family NAD(P)-dependent oxidoreductase [Aliivibrio finisterrensis]